MAREYIHGILKITTPILFLLTLAANFLYNRNGLVTRKTLRVTYVGFLLSGISLWILIWFSYNLSESQMLALILLGCVTFVVVSAVWAVHYFTLPYIEDMVEKKQRLFEEIKKNKK
jgi:Na+/melibiose symporter-like transporter